MVDPSVSPASRAIRLGSPITKLLGVLVVASACVAIALTVAVLILADRGYAFTDEGLYLNWLASPDLWPTSVSLFGFVYHPLFVASDGDIAQMRRVTVVLNVALCWVAAYLALGSARRRWPRIIGFGIATAVASVGLRTHNLWLLTPNYNILAFQGALLIVIGLLLWWESDDATTRVRDRATRERLTQCGGAAVIALGGVALFLAKPPAAAATAVLVVLTLALASRSWLMTGASAAIATLTLIAVTIMVDGSPAGTVDRLRAGAEEVRALDAGHSLWEILSPDAMGLGLAGAVLGFGSLCAFLGLTWALTSVPGRRERTLVLAVGGAATLCTAGVILLHPSLVAMRVPGAVLVPLAVPLGAIVCRLVWERRSSSPHSWRTSEPRPRGMPAADADHQHARDERQHVDRGRPGCGALDRRSTGPAATDVRS